MYMWLVIKCNEQLIGLERVDYIEMKLYVLQVSSSIVRKPRLDKLYQEWDKRNREWKDTLTTTITIFLYNPFIISLNHILNSIRVKYITQVSSMCLHILYSFFQMFVLTRVICKQKKKKEGNDEEDRKETKKKKRKIIML